jgi:2-polyprenyl-6-methoxyphenol hydroxylase-like FAD-dependent oxidoreductase
MGEVVVVGGSIAGLATALALAKSGVEVEIIESDDTVASPADVAIDARPGVPQHANAHNFLALGRVLLRDRAPEVLAAVVGAGACENRFERVFGDGGSGDDDLIAIACRRPVFEAALRSVVSDHPLVSCRHGRVTGIEMSGGRASGVRLAEGDTIDAAFIVDASGRRTLSRQWVDEHADAPLQIDVRPCPVAGYALHFALHDGLDYPDGRWLLGPGASNGHVTGVVFLGDNRTFTTLLITPPRDEDLAPLRHRDAYLRGVEALPVFQPWLERAECVSDVQFMGGIRNVRHHWMRDGEPALLGVQPIGDALVHTNPQHGWGASLAIAQAFAFADAYVATPSDAREVARAFAAAAGAEASKRYDIACRFDEEFEALPTCTVNPFDPSSALWHFFAANPVAMFDPEVAAALIRHAHMLEPHDRLREDADIVERVAARLGEAPPPTPGGPPRDEFVALINAS